MNSDYVKVNAIRVKPPLQVINLLAIIVISEAKIKIGDPEKVHDNFVREQEFYNETIQELPMESSRKWADEQFET